MLCSACLSFKFSQLRESVYKTPLRSVLLDLSITTKSCVDENVLDQKLMVCPARSSRVSLHLTPDVSVLMVICTPLKNTNVYMTETYNVLPFRVRAEFSRCVALLL